MKNLRQKDKQVTKASVSRNFSGLIFYGFLAVAGFFLVTEHWAHLLGNWLFLLLAACLLMHVFHGHGGHGGHGAHTGHGSQDQKKEERS